MVNNFTLPTENNTRDIFEIFSFINNTSSGGIFFPLVLLGIGIISFIGAIVEGRSASRAAIFSFFICSILGSLLSVLGLLSAKYVYLSIILLAIAAFWHRLSNPNIS